MDSKKLYATSTRPISLAPFLSSAEYQEGAVVPFGKDKVSQRHAQALLEAGIVTDKEPKKHQPKNEMTEEQAAEMNKAKLEAAAKAEAEAKDQAKKSTENKTASKQKTKKKAEK